MTQAKELSKFQVIFDRTNYDGTFINTVVDASSYIRDDVTYVFYNNSKVVFEAKAEGVLSIRREN